MRTLLAVICAAAPILVGCVSTHREIPFTIVDNGPASRAEAVPIRLEGVGVAEGGLLRPAIYWKPSWWTLLPLPVETFREKVRRLVRLELDRAGCAEEKDCEHSLKVEVEELALFTRGHEDTGYRQGYARLGLTLRSSGETILERTEEGDARFAGSRVRRSPGGSFLRSLYVYERKDPEPTDYAVRLAVRSFLEELRYRLAAEDDGPAPTADD